MGMKANLVCVHIAGALIAVAALPHALLGWPPQRAALLERGVSAEVIGALSAGWHFGSAAMVALGSVVLASARRLARGDRGGVASILAVAIAYVGFGVGACVLRHGNPHFLGFVALGLLAGLPLLGRPGPTVRD